MQIIIKIAEDDSPADWAIIELQGDLESRHEESLLGKFIGDLHYTKKDIPILIIGHHILYGKMITLDKPFAILEKKVIGYNPAGEDHMEPNAEETSTYDKGTETEYIVKAIVKKKLLFKTRPKPIIANVPKKV